MPVKAARSMHKASSLEFCPFDVPEVKVTRDWILDNPLNVIFFFLVQFLRKKDKKKISRLI